MNVLAAIRPDSWNFPLFLHVLGAMVLVGGLLAAGSALAFARGEAAVLRLGYWSLLVIALPGYFLMRIGAEWINSKEFGDVEDEPSWIGIGYLTADIGLLLLVIALIVGGIGVRKLRSGGGAALLKTTMAISLVLLAAYVVTIWAMSGKPD